MKRKIKDLEQEIETKNKEILSLKSALNSVNESNENLKNETNYMENNYKKLLCQMNVLFKIKTLK